MVWVSGTGIEQYIPEGLETVQASHQLMPDRLIYIDTTYSWLRVTGERYLSSELFIYEWQRENENVY